MREAAIPGYRLSKAKRSTRVLITLGLSGLFLGLASAALLSVIKIGLTPEEVRSYYLGSQAPQGSLDALMARSARPIAELAEVTHLHLAGGSMLLFFLCHLLALCDLDDTWRTILYVVSFGSFIVTFGSPWLIVYLHPLFSYLFGPAIVTFIASLFLCTLLPLREMWCQSSQ